MDNEYYRDRLNSLIPGGAHTYSRGDDQYPLNAPAILERGKDAYVFDPSGNKFLDYGMALRAVTVGYDYPEISDAAIAEIRKGNNLTRASLTELKAAEVLLSLVKGAEMVKFAKNGSTVTTAAMKLARAFTGRKYIAVCREHPFFSFDDWFIVTTPVTRGIPAEVQESSLGFHYNDIQSLENLFAQYPGQIAGVMLEPAATVSPCIDCSVKMLERKSCSSCSGKNHNFLHLVKAVCKKNDSVFILDEMITGFRWDLKGAQTYYDIEPDLSTFGKGMANGFSMAALVGKREIMDLGGILKEGAERVFLISTTHGAEMCSLGAFIKTVEVYERENIIDHLWKYGARLVSGMNDIARELGISDYFNVAGYACSPYYVTLDHKKQVSLPFRTLFSQEMIRNGVLIPWIAISFSHGEKELEKTLEATRQALKVYSQALNGDINNYLSGRSIRPVFRKYN